MSAQTCIICNQDSQEGRTWVKNASLVSVYKLTSCWLDFAQKQAKYGEAQYTLLTENLERLSSSELEQVNYHTGCYKSVVHKRMLERAKQRFRDSSARELQVTPAKIGRPSKSNDVSGDVGCVRKRYRTDPNCKSCAFQCENPTKGQLHIVQTDDMAKGLLT